MVEGTCSTPDCGDSVFCKGMCRRCYRRARYRAARPLGQRVCEHCGGIFAPTRGNHVICSVECETRRGCIRAAERKKRIRSVGRRWECVQCGADISHMRADAKYCSDTCANRFDYELNMDRIKASTRAWYEANAERAKETNRKWVDAHRDDYNARQTAWRGRHGDALREYRETYIAAWDPDGVKRRGYVHVRRARKLGNADSVGVTKRDWRRMVLSYGGCCAHCGRTTPSPHMDHVIPLSRGGRHAIGNVVPSCRDCNLSKSSHLLAEWRYGALRAKGHATA